MATNSITDKFLKGRKNSYEVETPKTGVWYSGFKNIKKYALKNKTPFFAVWSNGDNCGYCTRFEKNLMTSEFKKWMKKNNVIFWFGCSGDKETEDRVDGKTWTKNGELSYYPFVRFYWKSGKNVVDCVMSGNDWNNSKNDSDGANAIIKKLNKLLKEVEKHSKDRKLKIRTNPDWTDEEIKRFREIIKKNDGYCPCVDDKTDDSKCMCKWFRESDKEGNCHCGLYNKYFV